MTLGSATRRTPERRAPGRGSVAFPGSGEQFLPVPRANSSRETNSSGVTPGTECRQLPFGSSLVYVDPQ